MNPIRVKLGGGLSGFLFALQAGMKAKAVSKRFFEKNLRCISIASCYGEAMDRANMDIAFGNGTGFYDAHLNCRPSPYLYLRLLLDTHF
ncbi:MAG: hypothetical protein Tsb0021_17600 [Chlamydiales bacterium]